MTSIESRKRLLIAESEINREQLLEDWQGMAGGIHSLADRAKSVGSLASAAALLVAGVSAFRRGKTAFNRGIPSWPKAILNGAGLMSSLWLAFRSRRRNQKDK